MFDELAPLSKELLQNPIAFLGGFVAGALRLNPQDDPLKSWLAQQGIQRDPAASEDEQRNGSSPQNIEIE